jgi:hypothetical protein
MLMGEGPGYASRCSGMARSAGSPKTQSLSNQGSSRSYASMNSAYAAV